MVLTNCFLCRPDLAPELADSRYWRLILNRNQNLLGKCFLVLGRHTESVVDLTGEEWNDLQPQIGRSTRMLAAAFAPDHFNYAFLQNQDRHVHLHIIPRYAAPRSFLDRTFLDEDYPAHYRVPSQNLVLVPNEFAALAEYLQKHLDSSV